jgi:hypothetical protein
MKIEDEQISRYLQTSSEKSTCHCRCLPTQLFFSLQIQANFSHTKKESEQINPFSLNPSHRHPASTSESESLTAARDIVCPNISSGAEAMKMK